MDTSIFFPVAIPNHAGKLQLAMLHRPLFPGTLPEDMVCEGKRCLVDLDHESTRVSYCPMPGRVFEAPLSGTEHAATG